MRKSVSVALAAYNGEKYLRQQIDSILCQLHGQDEIVVSVDPSTDSTLDILYSYEDSRIKIVHGKGNGLISNFENAISNTKNEIIFLCDQDDIWQPNKVEEVLNCFDDGVMVVMHDAKIVNEKLEVMEESFFQYRHSKVGILSNIMKNSYIGCCMAFRKELKEIVLPFPKKLPMHDQYIGLCGEIKGKNVLLEKPLLLYRRHENNASDVKHAGVFQMIVWRIQIIKALL